MTIEELISTISGSAQHKYLYHFTDESNFEKINELGLVSKERMRAECWWPNTTGGDELSHSLDTVRGIDPFVSLCFTCNHPMKYVAHASGRLPAPKYLAISPNVLAITGVYVAFDIANANDTEIVPLDDALDRLDLEVIYTRTDWSNPEIQARLRAVERMEVLVPHCVPRELIIGVM